MSEPRTRDSNFELLRIFAMFIIILHHFAGHGISLHPESASQLSFNFFVKDILWGALGMIGNWLFIFTSGFFISEKSASKEKIFRLWFQIFSTSAIIGLIFYFAKIPTIGFTHTVWTEFFKNGFAAAARPVGLKDLVFSFMPCYFGNNWFANTYLVFLLLVLILDKAVRAMNESEHKKAIFVMTALGTIVPLGLRQRFFYPSAVFVFIAGFFIAKYIRLYDPIFFKSTKRNVACATGIFIFIAVYKIFARKIFAIIPFSKYVDAGSLARIFDRNESLPVMLCGLFLFMAFKNLKVPHNSFINSIAATTFGVYLIHENPLVKYWLYQAVLKSDSFVSSPLLLPYLFAGSLAIFAACSAIELLRKRIFKIMRLPA